MKTSYWDFRKYLEKYAEDFLVQMENMYSIAPFERLDKRFKKNKNIQNRRDDAIYKTLWKNFEYGLGEANEAEMLDFSKSIVDDLDLDGDPVGIKDTMDDYWEEQYRFIEGLNEYVGKWIRQVLLLITLRIIFLHLIIPAYWNVYIVYRLTIYYIFMADYIHIVMNLQFWDMEM